jgi:hypothetical protein
VHGPEAVDSPMVMARVLADEGAYLRHSEILALYVNRAERERSPSPFQGAFDLTDLSSALASIERLETLRSRLLRDNDRHALRALRDAAIRFKDQAAAQAELEPANAEGRIRAEIADWLRVWLQTPEVFKGWVELRRRSKDFRDKFGDI